MMRDKYFMVFFLKWEYLNSTGFFIAKGGLACNIGQ